MARCAADFFLRYMLCVWVVGGMPGRVRAGELVRRGELGQLREEWVGAA